MMDAVGMNVAVVDHSISTWRNLFMAKGCWNVVQIDNDIHSNIRLPLCALVGTLAKLWWCECWAQSRLTFLLQRKTNNNLCADERTICSEINHMCYMARRWFQLRTWHHVFPIILKRRVERIWWLIDFILKIKNMKLRHSF